MRTLRLVARRERRRSRLPVRVSLSFNRKLAPDAERRRPPPTVTALPARVLMTSLPRALHAPAQATATLRPRRDRLERLLRRLVSRPMRGST